MVRIKQLREQAGMMQVELAEKAGVSKQVVHMWESGDRIPGRDTLFRLAEIFSCRVEDIYTPDPPVCLQHTP